MAHSHHPAAHATAEDEYAVTPPGSNHEHTDASVGVIVRFGVWLLVSAVVVHVGMWLLFVLFVEQREEVPARQPYPIAVGQEPRLPAGARLQTSPPNELYEFRVREQQQLEGYGWADRAAGRVQIPISEAMRLVVERGLPARVQPAETPAPDPLLIPADSSSGRTQERRR